MIQDIREYQGVQCILGYRGVLVLAEEGVVVGEHNMMERTEERRKEHSSTHMDSLGEEKNIFKL